MVVQFKAKQNEIAKLAKINKRRANELIVESAAKKLAVIFTEVSLHCNNSGANNGGVKIF